MNNSTFNLEEYLLAHVLNSKVWHLPFLPPIHLPSFFSLHALMIIICSLFLVFLFCFVYKKSAKVPTGMTNVLEMFVLFIRDQIAIAYLGEEDGRRMTPFFCTMFFFILCLNLMGLIPVFSTATANINVTGALAFVTLTFMTAGAIYKNGIRGFLSAMIPPGVPGFILILVFPMELAGLFIRSFALMIRLFANMLAGHLVIIAFLGLVIVFGIFALPVVFFALFVSLLEVGIAFLQAYIFILLSAIFIGLTYHAQH